MKFPYTKFQDHPSPKHTVTILRPVIPVGLRYKGKTLPGLYNVLIDSGADDCIFHAEVGEAIGIEVKTSPAKTYGGVGFGELTGYLHIVEGPIAERRGGSTPPPCISFPAPGGVEGSRDVG